MLIKLPSKYVASYMSVALGYQNAAFTAWLSMEKHIQVLPQNVNRPRNGMCTARKVGTQGETLYHKRGPSGS